MGRLTHGGRREAGRQCGSHLPPAQWESIWENFPRLALCWGWMRLSSGQAPQRFLVAEGAEPECRRVDERGPSNAHSHARTHTGPSPPSPPWTSPSCPDSPGPAPSGLSPLKVSKSHSMWIPESGLGATAWSSHHLPPWGREQGRMPGLLPLMAGRDVARGGHGLPRAGPSPCAPPRPWRAGGVWAQPSPGWEGPRCASTALGNFSFPALSPQESHRGAGPLSFFKSALKSVQAAMEGRGHSSSARVCDLLKAH